MKILCTSPRKEGEKIADGWINIRRRIDGFTKNGFLIGVYPPIPIKQTYHDFFTDRMKTAWRIPYIGVSWRKHKGKGISYPWLNYFMNDL